MNSLRFEEIKRKAALEFSNKVRLGSPFPSEAQFLALVGAACDKKPSDPRKLLEQWHAAGLEIINRWDVRRVGTLIELFPGVVPAKWKGKRLTAYMADVEGSPWVVEAA